MFVKRSEKLKNAKKLVKNDNEKDATTINDSMNT